MKISWAAENLDHGDLRLEKQLLMIKDLAPFRDTHNGCLDKMFTIFL